MHVDVHVCDSPVNCVITLALCVCTTELCIQPCWFVTMYYNCIIVIYFLYVCQQKNRLFSALPLENLLSVSCCLLFEFKCLQCGLLCPASCTDRAIHAAFSNKILVLS